ncbi:Hypothetical protein LOCK908_2713 [Lacticaseibacillus rhamnosus LOCK908]|nr:hypothetical protein LRHK_2741 [Lacticaseibacillus rhamnosus ATCC 8530]AGP75319.1 Hypothetical protein LOCK908_2713 [Lacticaseibacillus rhamnosus LOCK908]
MAKPGPSRPRPLTFRSLSAPARALPPVCFPKAGKKWL